MNFKNTTEKSIIGRCLSQSLVLIFLFGAFSACEKQAELVIEEGTLQINGSEVYYKTMGEGEPLIIIHGGPVLDHSYFLPHFESLAKDHKLVFYDQRASGRSSIEIDSASMNIAGFVEDIELLRKELKLGKINLFGHSWGGLLAIKYAIKYNGNLNHLVLSNSMAPSVGDWQVENQKVAEKTNPDDQKRLNAIMSSGLLRTEDPTPYLKEMMMLSYKAQMYDTANLKNLILYMPKDFMVRNQVFGLLGPDIQSFDLYKAMGSVSIPTLILYGESEPAVELHADKMRRAFQNAELEIVKNAGHFPFLEEKESYLKKINTFISN